MSGWPKVELGDHVEMVTGFPFKSLRYLDSSEGAIRLLRGDNVAQGVLRWDGAKYWPVTEQGEYQAFALSEGDVILAMDRPWIEAGLKYAYVRSSDLPCLLVQRVARMRGTNGLSTAFLRYIVGSSSFVDHVRSITTGVNVPHISGKDIKRFRFHLPPLRDQHLIISIVGAYDDLIEANRRRIALLEEMAQRIFEEWLVHFRFPGNERAADKSSNANKLPRDWRRGVASDLIDFDPSTRLPRAGRKPFIPMASLSTSTSIIDEIEERDVGSGARFRNCDTLFARITPCLENGKTGIVRDLPDDGVGFGSTEFIVMRGGTAGPAFTYCLARLDRFRAHAQRSMSGATGRQRARTESMRQFELAVPPRHILDRFETSVWPMLEQVGRLGSANRRLAASRDLLLPRLISGDLSVKFPDREQEAAA